MLFTHTKLCVRYSIAISSYISCFNWNKLTFRTILYHYYIYYHSPQIASGWLHSWRWLSRIRNRTKRSIIQLQRTSTWLLRRYWNPMSSITKQTKFQTFFHLYFENCPRKIPIEFLFSIIIIIGMALVSILWHPLLIHMPEWYGIQSSIPCMRLVEQCGLSACNAIVS